MRQPLDFRKPDGVLTTRAPTIITDSVSVAPPGGLVVNIHVYIHVFVCFVDPAGLPSKFLTRLPGVCSGGGQVILQRF